MSTNRRETVTIRNLQGQADRVTLPKPHWEGSIDPGATGHGFSAPRLEALYMGHNSGRMFARFTEIDPEPFKRREGEGIGEIADFLYRELTLEEYLGLCLEAGVDPLEPAAGGIEV